MGAQFNTMKMPRTATAKELQTKFLVAQDTDRYENGHSYSGGFGMCTSLAIQSKQFSSMAAAEKYLTSTCEKWGDAIAITVTDDIEFTGWQTTDPVTRKVINVKNPTYGQKIWLIGALCAS